MIPSVNLRWMFAPRQADSKGTVRLPLVGEWGEMSELRAEHRLALARHGYVVIEAHMLDFDTSLKAL